jgi:hypothetical protein
MEQRSRLGVAAALFSAIAFTAQAGGLKDAWQARAASARAKLKAPGLDACDKAYEQAFAAPEEVAGSMRRSISPSTSGQGECGRRLFTRANASPTF